MPAAFLEEMLELRMEIEELKENPDSPQFAAMAKQLKERREKLLIEVGSRFAQSERNRNSAWQQSIHPR